MRKIHFITLVIILVLITGCEKKEEKIEEKTELATMEIISEELSTEGEVIAEGSYNPTVTDADKEIDQYSDDGNTLLPLNDDSKFNPEYTGIDNYQGEFNRYILTDPILEFMYDNNIKDICTKVDIKEYNIERNMYTIDVYYEKHDITTLEYFEYANSYTIREKDPNEEDYGIPAGTTP